LNLAFRCNNKKLSINTKKEAKNQFTKPIKSLKQKLLWATTFTSAKYQFNKLYFVFWGHQQYFYGLYKTHSIITPRG
jgi:hypothetical protein